MTELQSASANPLQSLTQAFLLNYPLSAARKLEAMAPAEAAGVLRQQKLHVQRMVLEKLAPPMALAVLLQLPDDSVAAVLEVMDAGTAVNLLSQLEAGKREQLLGLMVEGSAQEFRTLLSYPDNSVGQLMNTAIIAFNRHTLAGQAIARLRQQKIERLAHMFLLDDDMRLQARVDLQRLLLAEPDVPLAALATPVQAYVHALDPREEVLDKLGRHGIDVLPVVDLDFRLVGVLEGQELLDAVREDIATDIQTMVGASADERALSSTMFAVRKRLPWLQINLVSAFTSASVVGLFEDTIAQVTALAILMPIAAGQSGNTGAQALAVTMRGLTLREITTKHWRRVMFKECGAGFINGLCVAFTCSLVVWLWSRNFGLALVMALAIVLSMTMAATTGALVPMLLKRLGLDPAQSSTIVLTAITDITGFMSFLGIATLLSAML